MDCGFTYIPATGEITAFEFSDDTDTLTVTGTGLPTTVAGIQSLTFAQAPCEVSDPTNAVLDGTSITCTLTRQPVCGDHKPVLTTSLGSIPNNADLAAETVVCTLLSGIPDTTLNLLGQDNLTFTGTNFPHELEGNTFELVFDNLAETPCHIQSSSTSEIVCLTSLFDVEFHASQTYNMKFVINGQTVVNNDVSFTTKDSIIGSSDLNPNSVSPVLKTPIEIQLGELFPEDYMVAEKFSVNATDITDPSYVRYLNVLSVDPAARTMRCMFGGALSGEFQMSIRHEIYGLVNT